MKIKAFIIIALFVVTIPANIFATSTCSLVSPSINNFSARVANNLQSAAFDNLLRKISQLRLSLNKYSKTASAQLVITQSPHQNSAPSQTSVVSNQVVKDIFIETNKQRENFIGSAHLLAQNDTLNKIAAARAADMFKNQYFSHVSPDGTTMTSLIGQNGYSWSALGENIIQTSSSNGVQMVQSWMQSSSHRQNILNSYYTEIGLAAIPGQLNSNPVWIAVQIFARPR